jgi:hypothetical protein
MFATYPTFARPAAELRHLGAAPAASVLEPHP